MYAGCAGKTVRSLENVCHTWAPQRCVHDKVLYKSTFTFTLPYLYLYICCTYNEAERQICATFTTHFTLSWSLWTEITVATGWSRLPYFTFVGVRNIYAPHVLHKLRSTWQHAVLKNRDIDWHAVKLWLMNNSDVVQHASRSRRELITVINGTACIVERSIRNVTWHAVPA